jgi:hypothetical protein
MVTLTRTGRHMVAVDEAGRFFDEVYQETTLPETQDLAQ